RCDQHIHALPDFVSRAPELGEAVLPHERLGGRNQPPGRDDGTYHGQHRIRALIDELSHGAVALRAPWAVHEPARGQKGLEVDADRRPAERFELIEGGSEQTLVLRVPEELQLPGIRYAEAKLARQVAAHRGSRHT